MSDQLLDPIERGEARAEAWADEHVIGDSFVCCCGKLTPLSEGHPSSPDPYAAPVCGECLVIDKPGSEQ